VRQLIGVDDRAEAPDPIAGDVDRQRAAEPLLCVENERSRLGG